MESFEEFFHSPEPDRDKFLSRLFGIFNEEVVRHWCGCSQASYEDLGRPTLRVPGERRGHTLDFTFRSRETGKVYVAELKCEIEFMGYRYMRLQNGDELRHHSGEAFRKLLLAAKDPKAVEVSVVGKPLAVDGAVLVWGAVTSGGRKAVMREYGFADVLSLEAILGNLRAWAPPAWLERIERLRRYSNELFGYLLGSG